MLSFYKDYRVDVSHSNSFYGRYMITYTTPTGRTKTAYTNDSLLYDDYVDSIEDGQLTKKMFERIRMKVNQ